MQLNQIIFQLKCEWEKRYNGMKNKRDFTLKGQKFTLMISITIGRDRTCEKEKKNYITKDQNESLYDDLENKSTNFY